MRSKRTLKVEKEVRQILGRFILNRYQGFLSGIVSITRVVITGDLRQGKIYVSMMGEVGDRAENLIFLQEHGYEMQREISSSLPIKFCPKLQFFLDDTIDRSMKIDAILESITNES